MSENIFAGITPEKGRELLALAAQAADPEAIARLAAEQGVELSAEQAKELFDRLNADAALSDDEAAEVAGGGYLDCPTYRPCTVCGVMGN